MHICNVCNQTQSYQSVYQGFEILDCDNSCNQVKAEEQSFSHLSENYDLDQVCCEDGCVQCDYTGFKPKLV